MVHEQPCPDMNVLASFAEGGLQGEARAEVVRHVNTCGPCLELVTEFLKFQAERRGDASGEILSFPRSRQSTILWLGMTMAAVVLLGFLFGLFLGRDDGAWRQPQWWLAQYGPATGDENTRRAAAVFQRLRATVDGAGEPELVLIGESRAPIVLALDSAVVLSVEALAMCYDGVPAVKGDARLALVLGHELTHLREGETNHAFAAYRHTKGKPDPTDEASHQVETRADQWGLVYAAQAGFDPRMILAESESFLRQWVIRETPTPGTHPDAATRARDLADELVAVARELDDFHYGLRFYQTGQFEQAILLLQRFGARYNGREVHNNLGLAELGIALRYLGECDGALLIRFKLPFLLDNQTLAEAAVNRGDPQDSQCYQRAAFRRHLTRAIAHFQQALTLDPAYHPATLNLISAHLAANDGAAALALIPNLGESDRARTVAAVSLYLFGRGRGTEQQDRAEAIAMLASLPAYPAAVYNRAAILSESGGDAHEAFTAYLAMEPFGAYADRARQQLDLPREVVPSQKAVAPLAILTGPITPATESRLAALPSRPLELGDDRVLTIFADASLQVLREADQILMVEQTLIPPEPLAALPGQWQTGQTLETTVGKVLLGSDWILETRAGQVEKKIRFRRR